MTPEVSEALEGSIRKWEKIVADPFGFTDRCPLCELILYETGSCKGCPVMERSGRSGCVGTPFETYWDRRQEGRDRDDVVSAAEAELNFLKSLRQLTVPEPVTLVSKPCHASIVVEPAHREPHNFKMRVVGPWVIAEDIRDLGRQMIDLADRLEGKRSPDVT